MLASLDRVLRSVPMVSTLGIRAEEARPGHVVLRLPHAPAVTNHAGAIHTSAIFAVGELAAAVVLGTHPDLAGYLQLQKSTRIKYYAPSYKDVTAHAWVTPETLAAILAGESPIDVPIQVLDGHGTDVADLVSRFTFRPR